MGIHTACPPPVQPITLAMRVLHRLDGTLPFRRLPLRNVRPMLTLTFDDVPDSAVENGAPLLDAAGVRGTFYVTPGFIGRRTPFWRHADGDAIADLSARGHEIGLHSHDHRPVGHLGRRAFADDLAASRAALRALLPASEPENYAFPFGFANPLHRACLRGGTRSARTTHPGLNAGTIDPHRLLSHPLGDGLRDDAHVGRLLDEAAASRGWLILTLHDICPEPSPHGCTPDALARTLDGALARGLAIVTVSEALDLGGIPPRAPPDPR